MAHESGGRPSIYEPLLKRIRDVNSPGEFFIVRHGHKTRTVVSQLHTRYPGYTFRAVQIGPEEFNIEAAWDG